MDKASRLSNSGNSAVDSNAPASASENSTVRQSGLPGQRLPQVRASEDRPMPPELPGKADSSARLAEEKAYTRPVLADAKASGEKEDYAAKPKDSEHLRNNRSKEKTYQKPGGISHKDLLGMDQPPISETLRNEQNDPMLLDFFKGRIPHLLRESDLVNWCVLNRQWDALTWFSLKNRGMVNFWQGQMRAWDMQAFATWLDTSALAKLNFYGCQIDAGVASILFKSLESNTSLVWLQIPEIPIGDKGAAALSQMLKSNSTLTTLYLDGCGIGGGAVAQLADGLSSNSTLETIFLNNNYIGRHGMESLSEALKSNSSLKMLYLSGTSIFDPGVASLAEALKSNSSLETLDLKNNLFGDQGATSLAEALKSNSALKILDLGSNSIGPQGMASLSEALKSNSSLEMLFLQDNRIGPDGVASLSEALKSNSSLRHIYLEANFIGLNGTNSLAEAMQTNTTLMSLSLPRVAGDSAVYDSIEAALVRNQALPKIPEAEAVFHLINRNSNEGKDILPQELNQLLLEHLCGTSDGVDTILGLAQWTGTLPVNGNPGS
jgi:Ran GTPase-activating protein (RanGAP) involved in mRNA processing and transport